MENQNRNKKLIAPRLGFEPQAFPLGGALYPAELYYQLQKLPNHFLSYHFALYSVLSVIKH